MENSDSVFDRVLHSVGDDGKFQRRYNIVFNFCLGAASTMVYLNIVMALTIPNHWCHVPGRESSNYSAEEWKTITLPREKDSSGQEVYSSCWMYNMSIPTLQDGNFTLDDGKATEKYDKIVCQYGYEYDTTWYSSTAPSTENWVCEKELYVSNILAIAKLGEVLAGFIFGYLADTIGRKPVYIIAVSISCAGRIASSFLSQYYSIFLTASILATIPSTTSSQSGQVILLEISPMEDRANIVQFQNLGWTAGLSLLPLLYWVLQDWVTYILVSTAPLLIYLPLSYFLIESPRWLLSRGRVAECLQQLMRISKVNGTKLSSDSSMMLHNTTIKPEKTYGIGSLFSNWRLSKNTVLLNIGWICSLLGYNVIILNVASLSGNPFLNFFLQSMAEIPSYMLGKIMSEKYGRRFAGGFGFIIGLLGITPIILIINEPSLSWLQVILTMVAKFSVSLCFLVTSLQSLEIYPTSVRQSGYTLGMLCGNILSILGPYIVYLGMTYDARIPYLILATLCILGLISQILLPETLHEKLPETLQEARTFGKDQDYWSIPRKKNDLYVLANLKCVDNQLKEYNETDN